MDGVAAVLDKVVEDIERQECFVRISRIDMWEKRSGCLSGTVGLFTVDQLCELDIGNIVGNGESGVACLLDKGLDGGEG